jgi:hypothetical protein
MTWTDRALDHLWKPMQHAVVLQSACVFWTVVSQARPVVPQSHGSLVGGCAALILVQLHSSPSILMANAMHILTHARPTLSQNHTSTASEHPAHASRQTKKQKRNQ